MAVESCRSSDPTDGEGDGGERSAAHAAVLARVAMELPPSGPPHLQDEAGTNQPYTLYMLRERYSFILNNVVTYVHVQDIRVTYLLRAGATRYTRARLPYPPLGAPAAALLPFPTTAPRGPAPLLGPGPTAAG
eukprot:2283467-Pyramimonas_sp.AAC.1